MRRTCPHRLWLYARSFPSFTRDLTDNCVEILSQFCCQTFVVRPAMEMVDTNVVKPQSQLQATGVQTN